jgi:hypothetical protein
MRRLFLVLGALACLLILVLGVYAVAQVETVPVSDAEIAGVYEVTNWAIIPKWEDRAALTLNIDRTYTHSVRLKNSESHDSASTYTVSRAGTDVFIEFSNFELIPSFGFGTNTGHFETKMWRNWRGRVQFCYDSDVGYCYVKKD